MSFRKIKIGSRKSPLALAQVQEVLAQLKFLRTSVDFHFRTFETSGDRDKIKSLTQNPADDFFTDTIDRALIKGKIDVAIHSAKDLPRQLNPKLEIFALLKSLDDTDSWVGANHFNALPKGAKVGTSSLLRQQSIAIIRPDLQLISIRGTIQERCNLITQKKVDGVIVATCALKRLHLDHLIKDILPWESTALQGQVAIVGRREDHQLKDLFKTVDVRQQYGKVILVGAGPGDPELITIKAIKALKFAQCVFYDYLVDPKLLQFAPKAEHIYVGKRKGAHSLTQSELSRQVRLKAMAGKSVVRLKGGDPLIFGRGAEEIQYLRSYHIEVSVIPGISSATGIPSSLGIPLTARGISSSVSFLSAHDEHESKNSNSKILKLPNSETLVFFMGLSKIKQIVQSLLLNKWLIDTPFIIISKGTRREQEIVQGTIATMESLVTKYKPEPPALIIVGKSIEFYKSQENKKNILFLGTHPKNYVSLGNIVHFPMILIKPSIFSIKIIKNFYNNFISSSIVLLTSEYAVEQFFILIKKSKATLDQLRNKDFIVIGSHTAQSLLNHHVYPRLIATDETSEGLFKDISKNFKLKNLRILFPRSALPNPYLRKALTKEGAKVIEVTVYKNIKPPKRPLPKINIDSVIFTSPSTVVNFIKDYGSIPASWEILCNGAVSKKMLIKFGYTSKIIVN